MAKKKQITEAEVKKMRDIEAYTHDDKKRSNNPPAGMAQHDKSAETTKIYSFDPHLDPTLQWAGKECGHHNSMYYIILIAGRSIWPGGCLFWQNADTRCQIDTD